MDWPADHVERRALAELIPNARNARTHSEAQVAQIAASISEWGWTMPILVDEAGSIIAGHGRVLAGARLGIDRVPVMVARGWSDAQKRAYVIADNKLTENGGWDLPLLRLEVGDLVALGVDMKLAGFAEGELKSFMLSGKEAGDLANEWSGMPEFDQPDKTAFQSIVVNFKDQAAVDDFAKRLGQPISDRTRSLWHPPAAIETYVDKRYAANGA